MKPDWDDFREMNRTAIAALPVCGLCGNPVFIEDGEWQPGPSGPRFGHKRCSAAEPQSAPVHPAQMGLPI